MIRIIRQTGFIAALVTLSLVGCSAGASNRTAPGSTGEATGTTPATEPVDDGLTSALERPSEAPAPGANPSDEAPVTPMRTLGPSSTRLAAEGLFVSLPELPGGARARHTLTDLGGTLLLVGGLGEEGAFGDVLAFHPGVGRFEITALKLATPRYGHTATPLPGPDGRLGTADDALLIAGGFDGHAAVPGLELIQPDPDGDGRLDDARVVTLGRLPFGLTGHGAVLALQPTRPDSESVVVLHGGLAIPLTESPGGRDRPAVTNATLRVEVRFAEDGEAGARTEAAAQPSRARRDHTLTALPGSDGRLGTLDDLVLVVGGRGLVLDGSRSGATPTRARAGAADGDNAGDTDSKNGTHGETTEALELLSTPEVYEPLHDRWTAVEVLGEDAALVARDRHRAVRLGRSVLLFGGRGRSGGIVEVVELRLDANNPALAEAEVTGRLETAREYPEAALVDGLVLITGGFSEELGVALDSAELFDPSLGRVLPLVSRLGAPRLFHAVEVFGGRVFLTGGYAEPRRFRRPDAEFFTVREPGS